MKIFMSFFLALILPSLCDAQTCKSSIVDGTPVGRYQISIDGGEVTDTKTNLVWQRCSMGMHWDGAACSGVAGTYTWGMAISSVKNDNKPWRIPNVRELLSIVDLACFQPAINNLVFPATESEDYWSSSPYVYTADIYSGGLALGVNFKYGDDIIGSKSSKKMLRLVRSK